MQADSSCIQKATVTRHGNISGKKKKQCIDLVFRNETQRDIYKSQHCIASLRIQLRQVAEERNWICYLKK